MNTTKLKTGFGIVSLLASMGAAVMAATIIS